MSSFCGPLRDAWARAADGCFQRFPYLADPAERSSLGLKVAMVAIHLILVTALFAFDSDLIYRTRKEPWYTAVYLALVIAALFQYFFTSATSPGSWTCSYCNVLQPPRAKHCYDCDKCVLGFDHHCVWLGTCIGQGNHCRFWWFIFEESILSTWTCVMYITFLKRNSPYYWWKSVIMILFLGILFVCLIFLLLLLIFHSYLVLTNQTTYELARRRRISYLRGVPERVYPFSKGICRNIFNFCCARRSIYAIEPLPTAEELQARARPYTCVDVLSCRCC